MNKRLEQFMRSEGLTSAKFAEILSVQPSSISHLLSGRNNPNFDFISKLLMMFPNLNPHWIINGIGEMYLDSNSTQTADKDDKSNSDVDSLQSQFLTTDNYVQNDDNQSSYTAFTNVTTANIQTQNSEVEVSREENDQSVKTVSDSEFASDDVKRMDSEAINIAPDTFVKPLSKVPNSIPSKSAVNQVLLLYNDGTFELFNK